MLRNIIFIVSVTLFLSACMSNNYKQFIDDNNSSIALLPMYGYPKSVKTEGQKKADERFIKSMVADTGSREKSAKQFASWGWVERRNGKINNAMRRFNQSWLLDPNYYQPYWGFGAIALAKDSPAEAAVYFEKALVLIDDDKEKPRLFVDTAKSYALQGSKFKKTDIVKSEHFYQKSNSLIEKALNTDAKYGNAYYFGALIYYQQGNYKDAWNIVKKARTSGSYKFNPKFIDELANKMTEPK